MALTESTMLELGTPAPDFDLRDPAGGRDQLETVLADQRSDIDNDARYDNCGGSVIGPGGLCHGPERASTDAGSERAVRA